MPTDHDNPHVVKVVCDAMGRALYFSRAPIPYQRESIPEVAPLHHIGIYAYRTNFLHAFPGLTQGLLERTEMLEQLRALEHGFKIQVLVSEAAHVAGVDTAEDLEAVRQALDDSVKG